MKVDRVLLSLLLSCSPLIAQTEEAAPHWDYTGEADPAHWGELSELYAACADGSTQSPIDIVDAAAVPAVLAPLDMAYAPFPLELFNNGHTVQVTAASGNGFKAEGHEFGLVQFHFHAPSEYHLNGKAFPLELHLVHKNETGALGVVGVLFEEGAENPALNSVFSHLPAKAGDPAQFADVLVDVASLLPQDRHYYRLMGSLTTPPCSEGVNWYVIETPVTASSAQIAAFKALFPEGDARPIQASNNRLVVKGID